MAKVGIDEQTIDESEQDFSEREHKPDVSFDTVAGYDNARMDQSLLPPPPTVFAPPQDYVQSTFTSAPVITEDTAKP